MKRGLLVLVLALSALSGSSAGAQPLGSGRLANPAQEARAHAVFRQIRCVVCQNESIDDSEAPLAGDMRRIVRAQIAAGRSDAEIRRFLVDRYGQFVLLKPRFDAANALLWLGPFALVLAGVAGALLARRARAPVPALTADEEARLRTLRGQE